MQISLSHRRAILFIAVFSIAIYASTLKSGFVYDDESVIVNNTLITKIGNLPNIFQKEYFALSKEMSYRPVVTLTYFIDYALYGLNAWGYHLTNLLLHVINGVLIYIFLTMLPGKEEKSSPKIYPNKSVIYLIVSLLFVTHPVLSEAVNAISFREDLLTFFFYMTTLTLYIRLRTALSNSKSLHFSIYFISCLTYMFALLSKEMAVTLPLIACCYECIYRNTKKASISPLYYIIGYIIITFTYGYIRFYYFFNPLEEEISRWNLMERLLTVLWLFFNYVKHTFFSISLSAHYDITPVKSFFSPLFIIPFLLFLLLLVLVLKTKNCKQSIAFGTIFFFLTLIPVYNIIPIANPFADRYLYLPIVGFTILVANIRITNQWLFILFFLLIIIFSVLTGFRNVVWSNEYFLWSDTVKKAPFSWGSHYNLARAHAFQGRLQEAVEEYKTAIRLKPDFLDSYVNLGVVYTSQGRLNEAVEQYKAALMLNPADPNTHNNLGYIYRKQGRPDEAVQEYKIALRLNPDHIKARYNLGLLYISMGSLNKARAELETALKIGPDFLPARQALKSLDKADHKNQL